MSEGTPFLLKGVPEERVCRREALPSEILENIIPYWLISPTYFRLSLNFVFKNVDRHEKTRAQGIKGRD